MLLVDRKAQVEQLQLAIVPVQQIPPGGAVFASAPHVLPQPIEGSAFLGVPFGIVSICVADIPLKRRDPVNLVCSLERHGQHGRLRHGGRADLGRPRTQNRRVGSLRSRLWTIEVPRLVVGSLRIFGACER